MQYLGQDYTNEQDILKLLAALNTSSLEKAINKALNELETPHYHVAQFLLSFFPKVFIKETFILDPIKHPKLAPFMEAKKVYKNYLNLNIHELAGLLNAKGDYFNDKSLPFNALSFEHNEFEKNLNLGLIDFINFKEKFGETKLDVEGFIKTLEISQYAFNGLDNYKALLNFYALHIEGKETELSPIDKRAIIESAFKSLDFFKVAIKTQLIQPNSHISYCYNYHDSVEHYDITNCLQMACIYDKVDIFKYLVNELNIDVKKFFLSKDNKDLVFSTLLAIRPNTAQILETLFEHIEYDFNKNYTILVSPEKKNSDKFNTYYFISNKYMTSKHVTLCEYLEHHKEQNQSVDDAQKEFNLNYENTKRVIEKYTLLSEIKAQTNHKKIKVKI